MRSRKEAGLSHPHSIKAVVFCRRRPQTPESCTRAKARQKEINHGEMREMWWQSPDV